MAAYPDSDGGAGSCGRSYTNRLRCLRRVLSRGRTSLAMQGFSLMAGFFKAHPPVLTAKPAQARAKGFATLWTSAAPLALALTLPRPFPVRETKWFVEVGTPVTRRPPHRSQRAVFPHRALQVNSLSHGPSGVSPAAENPAAADRNSVPSGKAFPAYTSPQCTVWALGNGPASG